jgi:16S rRNA (uracil1498-N3)-methyltransferase
MSERFYAPDLAEALDHYVLTDAEAHHLVKVCRACPGDRVQLFNGQGLRADAELLDVARKRVQLRILATMQTASKAGGLILGAPLPKGERSAWLVEKCTELGVARLVPLETERSVAAAGDSKLEKLRRTSIEACKQCGRDTLMEIAVPTQWSDFASRRSTDSIGWMLHPSHTTAGSIAGVEFAAVGPEGGWTESELEFGKANGWRLIGLPGHILRVETAAIAIAALSTARGEVR